jgi:hypothetical protein
MSAYQPDDEPAVGTPIFDRTEYPGVHVPAYGTAREDLDPVDPVDAVPVEAVPVATDVTDDEATFHHAADHDTTDQSGTAHDAAGAARDVAGDAKETAQHVGGVAKDQASKVASEASDHARQLFGQASESVKDQAGQQQERAATGLRSISSQLGDMADKSDDDGIATKIVRDLSNRAGSVAGFLEGRDPGSLLAEVRSYAARKPGTFIAIAAGAGILAGRLTKALTTEMKHEKDADTDGTGGTA